MKSLTLGSLIVMAFALTPLKAKEKHALVIALSKYDASTGWDSISSYRDVPLITGALVTQGFKKENISVVTENQDGTKKGILLSLKKLTSRVQRGDIVVFHFSGHGQQIIDNNGDENDGYDESIVPINAPMYYVPNVYEGAYHIRDDELGQALVELRSKLGPEGDLMVILDSCYSGSATRGRAKHRGTSTIMAPADYQPEAKGAIPSEPYGLYVKNDQLAPMVCFSATAPDQLNWEAKDDNGNSVGALSLAISKALIGINIHMTYRGLFDKVRAIMAESPYYQTPQIEGNLDQKIFGGQTFPIPNYYRVVQFNDSKGVTINGGELHRLFKGTEITFYPTDTRDTTKTKPIAKGKIFYTDLNTADLELSEEVNQKEIIDAWGYVSNRNFGTMEVEVKMEVTNQKLKEGLVKKFSSYPFIKIVDEDFDVLVEQPKDMSVEGSFQVILANGQTLKELSPITTIEQNIDQIFNKIAGYAQVKFLRSIENFDKNLDFELEIIPVKVRKTGRRTVIEEKLSVESKRSKDGLIRFQKGDHFVLQLINRGNKKAYATLLDIQPNNEVGILLPRSNEHATDYLVLPGDTLNLDHIIWQMDEPYGTDVFKFISTESPINLEAILISRGSSTKGKTMSPFEELFANTFKEEIGTRGAETLGMPPSAAHIANTIVEIVPVE